MDLYGLEWPLLVGSLLGVAFTARAALAPSAAAMTRFAARYGLVLTPANRPPVAAYLRRAGLLRTLGGWLGLLVPALVTGLTRARVNVGGWELVLFGYLVGATLAEALVARPLPTGERRASLAPRNLAAYLPRWTPAVRWTLVLAAGVLAGWYAAAWRPGAPQDRFGGAVAGFLVCAAVAAGSEVLLRAVIRRRQPVAGEDLLAADDAIRRSSLHALAAASMSIQVLLLSAQLNDLGQLAQVRGGSGSTYYLGGLVLLALAVTAWSALRHPAPLRARPAGP